MTCIVRKFSGTNTTEVIKLQTKDFTAVCKVLSTYNRQKYRKRDRRQTGVKIRGYPAGFVAL